MGPMLLALALPTAGVIRAWISYRKTIAVEQWRTRRIVTALQSVEPSHRAEVIEACADLEAASREFSADVPTAIRPHPEAVSLRRD
jgi:hypothetical protein